MSQLEHSTQRAKREHLNQAERKIIERMLRQGANKAKIAQALMRGKSTIKREIKRGSVKQRRRNPSFRRSPDVPDYIEEMVYRWYVGQRVYEEHRANSCHRSKVVDCGGLVSFVEEKTLGKEKWSPDAAIGHAKMNYLYPGQRFTTKTFYNCIYEGLVKNKNIDLLHNLRRRAKSPRKERKKKLGRSIETRPAIVQTREEFGHWEGDGIVGRAQQGHLVTLVERKIGIGLLFKAGSRESGKIVHIIDELEKEHGSHFTEIFKTMTFDNGTEFSDIAAMEKDGRIKVYYAHPYSSFERGTNENWNGIVRRFIPKGSSFDDLTDADIQRINQYINTLPRKRLNYRTPLDLWHDHLNAILST